MSNTSARMTDYTRKVSCGSCDVFKFGEISDNISDTVQDRDMVATAQIFMGWLSFLLPNC